MNEEKYVEMLEDGTLYDFITNLQEENERLKELNENVSKVCIAEHRYGVEKAEEARDYKSRNEKALEINKKLQNIGILDSRAVLWLSQQENILNGGDEE